MERVNVQGTDEYGHLVVKVMDAGELSAAQRSRLYEAAPALVAVLERAADTLLSRAECAGDDPYWNKGGNGYETWCAVRAAIAEAS